MEAPDVALGVEITTGDPWRLRRGNRILSDGVAGVEVAPGVIVSVETEEREVVEGGTCRWEDLVFFSFPLEGRSLVSAVSSSRSFLFRLFFSLGLSSVISSACFRDARDRLVGTFFVGTGAEALSVPGPFGIDRFISGSSTFTRTLNLLVDGVFAKGGVDKVSSSPKVLFLSKFLLRDLNSLVGGATTTERLRFGAGTVDIVGSPTSACIPLVGALTVFRLEPFTLELLAGFWL